MRPRDHQVGAGGDVCKVQRVAPGSRICFGDFRPTGSYPLVEPTKGLVRKPLVVLDQVHPAARECTSDPGQLLRAKAKRLQCAAEQRTV